MVHYARLRPRLSKLALPLVWLALDSAAVSFFTTYQLATWQRYTIYSVALVLAIVLWAWPSARFSATFLDVTSTGVTIRTGFGSKRVKELSYAEISTVSSSAIKGLTIRTKDDQEYVLKGYTNAKSIAAELQRLV